VFLIGYSGGRGLSVSLEDNEVLGGQYPELYYRAPTEPGSSGSLVLNQYWEAVAMHQGGPRKHNGQQSNFGTDLQAIIDHARTTIDPLQISEESAAKLRPMESGLHGVTPSREAEGDASEPDYFSVFISYSHDDSAFALRLYNSLQSSGVRAWMDKHQMLPGDDIYEKLKQGIRGWDKLLLCCSRSSLLSWWVDNEIDEAFQKERELFKARGQKVLVLVPIDLDGYLFEAWSNGKAQQVKSRLAANFQGWTAAPSLFDQTFQSLLLALRTDPGVRELPPPPKL
jgi:TIR domain